MGGSGIHIVISGDTYASAEIVISAHGKNTGIQRDQYFFRRGFFRDRMMTAPLRHFAIFFRDEVHGPF